ncbi:MAG: chromate transporter, partial [Victivallaceae bacterium]
MSLYTLYLLFVKYGLLSFGGGYALVPLLIADLVHHRGIMTSPEFGKLVALAQMTPGPIGINTATYVGFTQQG